MCAFGTYGYCRKMVSLAPVTSVIREETGIPWYRMYKPRGSTVMTTGMVTSPLDVARDVQHYIKRKLAHWAYVIMLTPSCNLLRKQNLL